MRKVLFAAACAVVALLLIALIGYALFAMQSQPPSMAIQRALDEERVKDIAFYGTAERGLFIAFPATAAACALLLCAGFARRKSVFIAKIGEHSEFPVHYSQIRRGQLAEQLTALTTAEQLRQSNAGLDAAFQLYRALAETQTRQIRAAAQRALPESPAIIAPAAVSVPTFADLLRSGNIAPGKPLIFGFSADGAPQTRQLTDIKAMSIAGFQGSGKTLSTAYLVTCGLMQFPSATAFVIDPHRDHPESLAALLQPFDGERLRLVNPFEIAETMDSLQARLDARLQAREASDAPIFLVIDELASVGNSPVFGEKVLPFLERCTEETRKANIVFFGCSTKWNARHFGGKADIRAAIPSLLVHKMKPSQADLLLEGADEKKLLKALTLPGQALLATSHDADPQVVTMPLITKRDIAALTAQVKSRSIDRAEVKPLDLSKPERLTGIDRANARVKAGEITQKELADRLKIDEGFLSRILRGKKSAPERIRQQLEELGGTA